MSTDWHQRWDQGKIRFHSGQVHPDLLEFEESFLGGESHRVLVPLCGKSVDMPWLAERGHEVVYA